MFYVQDEYPANIASLEAIKPASAVTDQGELIRIFKSAGKVLRNLQALPVDKKEASQISKLVRKRIRRDAKKLNCFLPKDIVEWLYTAANNPVWDHINVGFCHHHYTPAHWLAIRPTHALNIIDLEDAGIHFLSKDIVTLWYEYFMGRHDLCDAFFEGYGKTVTPAYLEELRYVSILYGLELMAASSKNRDSDHFHRGIEVLRNAAEGTFPPSMTR